MGRAKIAGRFLPEVKSGCSQSGGEAELRGEGTRRGRDWGPLRGPPAPGVVNGPSGLWARDEPY